MLSLLLLGVLKRCVLYKKALSMSRKEGRKLLCISSLHTRRWQEVFSRIYLHGCTVLCSTFYLWFKNLHVLLSRHKQTAPGFTPRRIKILCFQADQSGLVWTQVMNSDELSQHPKQTGLYERKNCSFEADQTGLGECVLINLYWSALIHFKELQSDIWVFQFIPSCFLSLF